jgi:hypothetical protein
MKTIEEIEKNEVKNHTQVTVPSRIEAALFGVWVIILGRTIVVRTDANAGGSVKKWTYRECIANSYNATQCTRYKTICNGILTGGIFLPEDGS